MAEIDYKAYIEDYIARNTVPPEVFEHYDVKRGLRNADGTGVVAGVTNISNVSGYMISEGDKIPTEGKLTIRGYDIRDLVEKTVEANTFGYEEIAYLLMIGNRANSEQRARLIEMIDDNRELPDGFTADVIMKDTSRNIMNMLQRCVSMLYSYDEDAETTDPLHELTTAISLISRMPRIMVLSYYAMRAKHHGESMIMHRAIPGQSAAETILSMLRLDRTFTHEEAVMLDVMLMLHAEHGGGNNSTFTCRCLTSSGTDPYSAYAGAIGSLKGFRHGGANIKVLQMHREMEESIGDWSDEGQVGDYLRKIVAKEAFDRTGLIYGMGHAVYTLSDPRAEICKKYASQLAHGTEFEEELEFLKLVERLAPEIIAEVKGDSKLICANIDMYTGFVYRMLKIPEDLITPIFACARMAGWSAHRFEELVSGRRIMRPAYKSISRDRVFELPED